MADPARKLLVDPIGREMLISCGAALFGLRLAVRSLGYLAVAELLPDPRRLRFLARLRLGAATPMTAAERQMLDALPHRHTHRAPFVPGPLPTRLGSALQHDALAEGARLVLDPQIRTRPLHSNKPDPSTVTKRIKDALESGLNRPPLPIRTVPCSAASQ